MARVGQLPVGGGGASGPRDAGGVENGTVGAAVELESSGPV